jgi:hypothetical protein
LAKGASGGTFGNSSNGGGVNGTPIAGSIGGSATYSGGAGLSGINGSYGGGGGSSAGTDPGTTGSNGNAAAAVAGGGPGGAARLPAAIGDGFAPTSGPGGGGGGGLSTGTSSRAGGNGWDGQVIVTFVGNSAAVIPITPTNILATAAGGNLNLSWPSSYLGWSLQVQTNILSTNWVTIPGCESVTATNFPFSTTNGAMFYRMFYQP